MLASKLRHRSAREPSGVAASKKNSAYRSAKWGTGGVVKKRGSQQVPFRTTKQVALNLESGIKPAVVQLDNRLRRFALRLASLSLGDQARKLVGTSDSALGQRLQSALRCWHGREETVLLEVAFPLDVSTTIAEETAVSLEARRLGRPGLSIFTDGFRLENRAR